MSEVPYIFCFVVIVVLKNTGNHYVALADLEAVM